MSYPQSYPQSTQLFYGRSHITREIVRGVLAKDPGSFVLVGPRLIGKSTLLKQLVSEQSLRQKDALMIAQFDCAWQAPDVEQGAKVARFEALYRALAQQVRLANLECSWTEIEGQANSIWRI